MPDAAALGVLLFLHLALCALCLALARRVHAKLPGALAAFMLLLPLFGPLCVLLLTRARGRPVPDGEWMKKNETRHQSLIALGAQAKQTVPLEEALLINDPRKRRALMMNVLRADPRKYLDLLLIARFNEDTETAHYATATIMEVQRQMQLEIQQCQAELKDAPGDAALHERYACLLNDFCESGLLEGQLLRRQRLNLLNALKDALALNEASALYALQVKNCLALKQGAEARQAADAMLANWPQDENSWLEALRVCVETRDQQGLRALAARAQGQSVDWTSAGRERFEYWSGRQP